MLGAVVDIQTYSGDVVLLYNMTKKADIQPLAGSGAGQGVISPQKFISSPFIKY